MEWQARINLLQKTLGNLKDLALLQKLETVIQSHQDHPGDWWNHISTSEREDIEAGIQELDGGHGIPHGIVRSRIDAKLGT